LIGPEIIFKWVREIYSNEFKIFKWCYSNLSFKFFQFTRQG